MVFFHLFFHKKRWGRQGFGEDSPAGRGKCREATKGDGARARGLSRPQRRDLQGLKNNPFWGLGDPQQGEALYFKIIRPRPGRAKSSRRAQTLGSVKPKASNWVRAWVGRTPN